MKWQVSVLIRARHKQKQHKLPWHLSVNCSVDSRHHNKTRALISRLHQWPVETSRDSFWAFFGSVTQVQTHFPDSTRVIYFSMSTNGEFLISWPLLASPKPIWHSMESNVFLILFFCFTFKVLSPQEGVSSDCLICWSCYVSRNKNIKHLSLTLTEKLTLPCLSLQYRSECLDQMTDTLGDSKYYVNML